MPDEMEMKTEKEQDKLSLLETWRQLAYASAKTQKESDMFWANYFNIEKGIYEEILKDPENPVCGTVAELADKFGTQILIMTGFLDGINESLKTPNPIETMTEDTVVSLEYDIELLYKNMVEAKAEWLYTLDAWNTLIPDENRRKELYREQKISHTIVKDKKVGRNDPCPCGSGRKYKHCCGK